MKYPDFTDALCKEIGVEVFFPEDSSYGYEERYAKKLCSGCPIIKECLEWALHHENHGIWGGTTPMDRRFIRRTRNISVREILAKDYL